MKAKSIFSKIVAGVLAAGMVVTMLPGLSMTAKAADVKFYISPAQAAENEILQDTHRDFRVYNVTGISTASSFNVPRSALEGLAAINGTTPAAGTTNADANLAAATYNDSVTGGYTYLLVIPDEFYQFRSDVASTNEDRPSVWVSNATKDGKEYRGNDIEVRANVADDAIENGKSYIVKIPNGIVPSAMWGEEADADKFNYFTLNFSNAYPIEVKITVNLSDSVVGRVLNEKATGADSISKTRTYTMRFDKKVMDTGRIPTQTGVNAAIRRVQRGAITIGEDGQRGVPAIVFDATATGPGYVPNAEYGGDPTDDKNKWVYDPATAMKQYYTSASDNEIIGAANDPRINVHAHSGSDMTITITNGLGVESSYNGHKLTTQKFNVSGIGSIDDLTPYIEFANGKTGTDEGKVTHGTDAGAGFLNPLPTGTVPAAPGPMIAPFSYPDPVNRNSNVYFSINWKNMWDLFFFGHANNENSFGDAGKAASPGTAANDLGHRTFGAAAGARKNEYKSTTINLGAHIGKGNIIVHNMNEIGKDTESGLNGVSNANIYTHAAVIRDENGKRFDETLETGSYSGDPDEVVLSGYKTGDTFKFTVLIDPMFEKDEDLFRVVVTPRGKEQILMNLTGKEDENGVYSFVCGDDFDYEVHVEGLKPIEQSKLVEIVNIPEYESRYYRYEANHAGVERFPLLQQYYSLGRPQWMDTAGAENDYSTEDYFQDLQKYPWYRNATLLRLLDYSTSSCHVHAPRYMIYMQANEEDTDYLDVVPFAIPRATATADEDFVSDNYFPAGEYKFKIRYTNQFESVGHGIFNDYDYDDRYSAGPEFKVTANDTALTADSNGLYTLTVKGDEKRIEIKVDGIVNNYRVLAPNVAAYSIETDGIDMRKDQNDNFVSSVQEGTKYRFKINMDEGVKKGPNFRVELAQATDGAQQGDNINNTVRTQIPEGKDGWYEFTVNNDVEIIVSGVIGGEGFSDTANRSAEEQEAINWLKDQGVIEGYGDDSFRPGNNLTRAEFVKMLYALKGGTAGSATFSDTASHWAKDMIGWGSGEGIVNGYPDGTFRPDASISRAEVCQIMWKLNGKPAANMIANFNDVSQGAWYAPAVNSCFEKGIVKGYGNGFFGTNDPIERAHMALILYRAR